MTKAELVDKVSRSLGITWEDSGMIIESIFDSMISALRGGDKVEIRGFGSFRTRQRPPRVGRNPKTGESVQVLAKRIPYFKPGKELKSSLISDSACAESVSPESVHQSGMPGSC